MMDLDQSFLAKEIGVSASTLCRLEKGKGVDGESFGKILLWLLGREEARRG